MRGFFLTSEELNRFHELGLTHFQRALYVHIRGLADETGTVYQSLGTIAGGMSVKGRQGSAPEPCSRQQIERAVVRLENVGLASKVRGKIFLPFAQKAETPKRRSDIDFCQRAEKKAGKKAETMSEMPKPAPDMDLHGKSEALSEKKAETMSDMSKPASEKDLQVKSEAMSGKKAEKLHGRENDEQEKSGAPKPTPDIGLSAEAEKNEDEMYKLTETINQLVKLKVNKGASREEIESFVEVEAQKIEDFLTAQPYMAETNTALSKQYYCFWVLMGKQVTDIKTIASKIEARKDPAKDGSIVPLYFNTCFANAEKDSQSKPKQTSRRQADYCKGVAL